MKKILAFLMIAIFAVSVTACNKDNQDESKTLRIACWNDEFKTRFQKYYVDEGKMPEGVKVEYVITPNEGNNYQDKLDSLLEANEKAAPNDKIDLFMIEADYADKYISTDYALDVKGTIGLTEANLANQYGYTKDICTDSKGILRGVSWQATPGGFIYRRSYAKEVLGTDDPTEVQAKLDTWGKFDAVAKQMHDSTNQYAMLSGFDDAFRVFSNNVTAPWVDANKKVSIDSNIEKWIDQTKTYTDNGYNHKASLWSDQSNAGMGKDGKVFGYFGPAWFIDFTMAGNSLDDADAPKKLGNGSYGDWAMCQGPETFFWGGTWICGAKGTDNLDLVKDVMKVMTCDKDTLLGISKDYSDFTNNVPAMTELANDTTYHNAFLGGQNNIGLFLDSAQKIDTSKVGAYDQGCVEEIQGAMKDYFNGTVTKKVAIDNFYKAIVEKYPALSR